MTPDLIIVILITITAAFIQGASGFGFALVAMPVLAGLTSIYVAVPFVALGTLTTNTFLWMYYRQSCDLKIVGQLLVGALLGLPLGFLVLQYIPVKWMLITLGFMIVAYGIYALASPVMPVLKAQGWIYGAGFAAGILMGGYNLPGPPVILYGSSQRWPQVEFKGILSRFFWVNAFIAVLGHGLQNRLSKEVLYQFLVTLPGLVIGLFMGIVLAKSFNPLIFRRSVLALLIFMGIRLIILGVWP